MPYLKRVAQIVLDGPKALVPFIVFIFLFCLLDYVVFRPLLLGCAVDLFLALFFALFLSYDSD